MIGSHPIASTPIAAGLAQQQAAGTGTVARTLDAATLASTGKVYIVASLAKTLANATSLSSADLYIDADLSRTLASATLVATGTVGTAGPITGTVARTLAAATLSSTATMEQPPVVVPVNRGDSARGRAFREAARRAAQSFVEEEVRRALGRFKGKRSKPRITSDRLTAAAEAILNAPDIPEWEFKRVGDIINDILGAPFPAKPRTTFELGQRLLELAEDARIEEDDEEAIEFIISAEIDEIMSL